MGWQKPHQSPKTPGLRLNLETSPMQNHYRHVMRGWESHGRVNKLAGSLVTKWPRMICRTARNQLPPWTFQYDLSHHLCRSSLHKAAGTCPFIRVMCLNKPWTWALLALVPEILELATGVEKGIGSGLGLMVTTKALAKEPESLQLQEVLHAVYVCFKKSDYEAFMNGISRALLTLRLNTRGTFTAA